MPVAPKANPISWYTIATNTKYNINPNTIFIKAPATTIANLFGILAFVNDLSSD